MNKLTTRTIEAFIDEAGILHIKILAGAQIDLDDAADNFLTLKYLSAGQKRLKLIDARGYWEITKKARDYSEREDIPQKTIAKAILVKGIISKVVNTFLTNQSKPQIPVRFFLFEKKALKWLNSFRYNQGIE